MNIANDDKIIAGLADAARSRADAWEVYAASATALDAYYDKGKLGNIEHKGSSGAALRAVKNGRLGFAVSTRPQAAAELADSAVRLSRYGREMTFSFCPKLAPTGTERFVPAVTDVSPEALVNLGNAAKEMLAEHAPDALFGGTCGVSFGESCVITSEGQHAKERYTHAHASVHAECIEEGNFVSVYDFIARNGMVGTDDIAKLVKSVAAEFAAARRNAPIKQGTYRVLFSPGAMADVIRPVIVSVNGSAIEKKTSRWIEARGRNVLDPRISVYDDPSDPEGTGSGMYDGEGMPANRRAIVEKGVLRGFMHTRSTAAACGDEATGNAQRGLNSQPAPGFHNFIMEGGDVDVAHLKREAEDGLYVSNLLGVFTSNFLAGQVSGNISLGYLVKDGGYVGRVKNAALNVNAFETFGPSGRIVGISRERQWHGQMLLPWVLVEGVAISAR